jgi:hypothetical protein
MTNKAERLPISRLRHLKPEQREAVDRLAWYSPGPAQRARLKKTLGWKRTKEETLAWARELLAEGRMVAPIARELGVEARYLKRLLQESETPQNGGRKASSQAEKVALTRESDTGVHWGGGERG